MGKRDENREELRTRLLDVAERHIAEQGLTGLKARDVAAEAGVALVSGDRTNWPSGDMRIWPPR